jgi:hypothetical protein
MMIEQNLRFQLRSIQSSIFLERYSLVVCKKDHRYTPQINEIRKIIGCSSSLMILTSISRALIVVLQQIFDHWILNKSYNNTNID